MVGLAPKGPSKEQSNVIQSFISRQSNTDPRKQNKYFLKKKHTITVTPNL